MTKRNRVSGLVKEAVPPIPAGPSKEQERRWRAEGALDTLTRACEIQRDKALMREVKKIAHERVEQLRRIQKGSRSGPR